MSAVFGALFGGGKKEKSPTPQQIDRRAERAKAAEIQARRGTGGFQSSALASMFEAGKQTTGA